MIDDQENPPPPPPLREDKLPPAEDLPDAIELPGTPQLPIIPDEDVPSVDEACQETGDKEGKLQ